MLGRVVRWFSKPAAWGATALAASVAALAAYGGFSAVVDYTNRMEFCISCHEMKNTVYAEYQHTPHFSNPSGVRAVCADCHVPKALGPKLWRKIQASGEVWGKITGVIDTPEKFEAKRLELAKRVWASMAANDSRECRNCHSFETMTIDKQRENAQKLHPQAIKEGDTCISCHKGIAHKLPDMKGGYKKVFEELLVSGPRDAAKAERLFTLRSKPLFLDPAAVKPGGKGDGVLLPATEVAVVGRSGDLLKVRLDGWQQDGVAQMIYARSGKRIFSAALGKPGEKAVETKSTMVDPDTEQRWNEVALTAWISNDDVTSDATKLWAYAGELYNASCGTCHTLRAPSHYLANQWIGSLDAMKRFISLDKEEYRFLQKYLQLNARDTGGATAAH
ncbi:NapC/NirT family cytochrome c [Azospirillum sp.]|uniref:NapC/NirT family cytochrome c n=1 Tax=Azospirillum sp. TaxID=34012 RepID=UPI003D746141